WAHKHSIGSARTAFAELETAPRERPVFNLRDREKTLGRIRELLETASDNLLVGIQPREAAELAPALAAARKRGIDITTLCMEACEVECGGCTGDIHRCCMAPAGGARWLMVVADGERMVAAEMHATKTRAIATAQPLVVELAAAYIRQSVALATLGG